MISCSNCGAGIPDNETFCGQCGAPRPDSDLFSGSPKAIEQPSPAVTGDQIKEVQVMEKKGKEFEPEALSPNEAVLEGEILPESYNELVPPKRDNTCLWVVLTCLAFLLLVLCVLCFGVVVLIVFFQELFTQMFGLSGIFLVS